MQNADENKPPGPTRNGAKAVAGPLSSPALIDSDRGADFTRDRRLVVLALLALPIGAAGAMVALGLVWLIGVITNLCFYLRWSSSFVPPTKEVLGPWIILLPVVGGLIVGLMARYGTEKIRGHGIPEALEAILIGQSRLDLKVAILKPLSSAISIGTGGPFGAEGPIVMTGAAVGSLFAQLFPLTVAERKVLLVAGAAAGMAAIFNSPVAAVLIAVELLLFEWRPRSFVPIALASATAVALRVPLLGSGPMFPVGPLPRLSGWFLPIAGAMGLIAGLASCILTLAVYRCEDLFRKLPVHWMWWPAIGGIATGLAGWIEPRVLGVGYNVIRELLEQKFLGTVVLALLVGKAVAWSIALGSGTSGGVLAPVMIVGGALGALEAGILNLPVPAAWVMISMAAVFGGTLRAPLTAIVFTLELTHNMGLLGELLVACTAAHALTVLVMRHSILTEKVARRGYHLTLEYTADPLEMRRVRDAMTVNVPVLPATMQVRELAEQFSHGDPWLVHHHSGLVVDEAGLLTAVITWGDVVRALERDPAGRTSVLKAGTVNPLVAYPDETVRTAARRLVINKIGRLPVVSRENPRRLVGFFGRESILAALLAYQEQEREEQPAWHLRRHRRSPAS